MGGGPLALYKVIEQGTFKKWKTSRTEEPDEVSLSWFRRAVSREKSLGEPADGKGGLLPLPPLVEDVPPADVAVMESVEHLVA